LGATQGQFLMSSTIRCSVLTKGIAARSARHLPNWLCIRRGKGDVSILAQTRRHWGGGAGLQIILLPIPLHVNGILLGVCLLCFPCTACCMQVKLFHYQHPFATPKNIGNVRACPCRTTDFMQQNPCIQLPVHSAANMQKRSRVDISQHCNTRAETYLKTFASAQKTPLPLER
jgi:hypothetical protein